PARRPPEAGSGRRTGSRVRRAGRARPRRPVRPPTGRGPGRRTRRKTRTGSKSALPRARSGGQPNSRWPVRHPKARATLFPDRRAVAGQAETVPHFRDPLDDLGVHADLLAPLTLRLGRPFVGGVKADL